MNLIGIQVSHAKWGVGQIIAHDSMTLTVEFSKTTIRFIYPEAIGLHIQATDPVVHAALLREIEDFKAAKVAQQKAAEEAKKAEAEKQIATASTKESPVKAEATQKKASAPKQERVAGKPMTFFVFQDETFDRQCQGGYLWAPITNKGGDKYHHWDRMLDVRAGDVILHGHNAHVQAVSIACAACYDCVQPQELRTEDSWDWEGRRVNSDYIMLQTPIKTADYIEDIIRLCNTKYAPFNKNGTGNQGYLYEIHREMAKIFLDAAVSSNPYLKENQVIVDLLSE